MNDQGTTGFQGGPGIFEDLGFISFYRKLRKRMWLLLLVPIFLLVFANVMFFMSPKEYRGTLEVTSATVGSGNNQGGSMASGLLGSSLLGGFLGDSSMDPLFKLYTESWTSNWLAQTIASDPAMLRQMFSRQWSEEGHAWKEPRGPIHFVSSIIMAVFGVHSQWSSPGADAVHGYLTSHVQVLSVRGQVITKIVVEDTNPKLVQTILRLGHEAISNHLRDDFRARARENSDYLLSQLNKVQVAEYREVLINQLTQQQKYLMLTFSKSGFAAQVLGTHVTENPVSPRPGQILFVALLISIACYVISVFVADRWNWPLSLPEFWSRRGMIVAAIRMLRRW